MLGFAALFQGFQLGRGGGRRGFRLFFALFLFFCYLAPRLFFFGGGFFRLGGGFSGAIGLRGSFNQFLGKMSAFKGARAGGFFLFRQARHGTIGGFFFRLTTNGRLFILHRLVFGGLYILAGNLGHVAAGIGSIRAFFSHLDFDHPGTAVGKVLANLSGLDRFFQLKLTRPAKAQLFALFFLFGLGHCFNDPI